MVITKSRRPPQQTRRVGYGIGALVGLVGLYLINVWPGWEAVPFLTAETTSVLILVNASIAAGIVANVAFLWFDRARFVAAANLVTTGIGLAAMIRLLQVFPFDFSGWGFDGTVLVRIVLVVGIVGSVIGAGVQIVTLVRGIPVGGGES